ncbi:MAG: hypothetical protein AB7T31_03835 [Gemmatimonadales bacterium]
MIEPKTRTGDDDLGTRFHELRADNERAVPPFAGVLERAAADARAQPALGIVRGGGSRRRVLKMGAWASAALAAAVAGILLVDRPTTSAPSADEQFAELVASYATDMSAGAWRSPTSSLLEVPGIELMRSVPSIGASADVGAPR